jgi:hypothetical protein
MTRYLCQMIDVPRSGFFNSLHSAEKLADEQAGAFITTAFFKEMDALVKEQPQRKLFIFSIFVLTKLLI